MALGTPMVSKVTGRVFNHPDSKSIELQRFPNGLAFFAHVHNAGNFFPIGYLKWNKHKNEYLISILKFHFFRGLLKILYSRLATELKPEFTYSK
jgi:hypothetical protein